jgi:hypothetical protein
MKEADEQAVVFEWAKWMQGQIPELKWMFHIPNGGSRNPREAKNLKRQGVKKGVSDIFLPVPRHGWSGLWIELKVENNKLTPEQAEFQEDMRKAGYWAEECRCADKAINTIREYLHTPMWRDNNAESTE